MPPTAAKLINAVNHPLRRRILFAFVDGSVQCPSAEELAEALEQRVGQVAYHLKTLAGSDLLRPVRDGDPRAGEARYGWTLDVETEWLRLLLEVSEATG